LSARFAYNSSFHPRIFRGNKSCWYSVFLVAILQVATTYIPGLNSVIFSMAGMDGPQWGITFLGMAITFIVMEFEKSVRRCLKRRGADTDDREADAVFDSDVQNTSHLHMPDSAGKLGTSELKS